MALACASTARRGSEVRRESDEQPCCTFRARDWLTLVSLRGNAACTDAQASGSAADQGSHQRFLSVQHQLL